MIDQKLIAESKKRLLEEHARLEGLLRRVAKKDGKSGVFQATYEDFGSKEDENASEVAVYAEHVAEEHDLEAKLNQVKAALKRIETGEYGICLKGGEEIAKDRLGAVPEAENCIKHAA